MVMRITHNQQKQAKQSKERKKKGLFVGRRETFDGRDRKEKNPFFGKKANDR